MNKSSIINDKLNNYLLFGFNLFLGILILFFLLKDFNPQLTVPSSRAWAELLVYLSQFFFWLILLSIALLTPISNGVFKYSLIVLTLLILNVSAYLISFYFLIFSLLISILLTFLSFYFYRKNANIVYYLCFTSIIIAIVSISVLAFT